MAWQIDKSHTSIEFSVRHMMISKVRGRFESFEGTIDFDEANPENTIVRVTVDPASINTRDAQRDAHLRSPDFFDAEKYPQSTFNGTRVERTGDSATKLYGDLTIRDVTKPVVLDVTHTGKSVSPYGATSYGFEAATKINRKDWGLEWNMALETGGMLVSDEVSIFVELELMKVVEASSEAVAS